MSDKKSKFNHYNRNFDIGFTIYSLTKIEKSNAKIEILKNDLQFKQKRNNKQDSAYIRHREE